MRVMSGAPLIKLASVVDLIRISMLSCQTAHSHLAELCGHLGSRRRQRRRHECGSLGCVEEQRTARLKYAPQEGWSVRHPPGRCVQEGYLRQEAREKEMHYDQ